MHEMGVKRMKTSVDRIRSFLMDAFGFLSRRALSRLLWETRVESVWKRAVLCAGSAE